MKEIDKAYMLYFNDIFLYVLYISKDEKIAEEVTQETFFKALKGIDKFKGECDIKVWLLKIAKNTYYSHVKKRNKEIDINEIKNISDNELIEDKLVKKEYLIKIYKFLHNMDEPYKEVFFLRVFGNLNFKDIGCIFDKSDGWARVTYHRARIKIMRYMEENNEW